MIERSQQSRKDLDKIINLKKKLSELKPLVDFWKNKYPIPYNNIKNRYEESLGAKNE